MKLIKVTNIILCFLMIAAVLLGCDMPEESKAVVNSKDDLLHNSEEVSKAVLDTASENASEEARFIIVDYRDSHEFLDTGISTFYQDETYTYFFSMSQMHEYIIVEYEDGTTQNVKEALEAGNITIADLDRFNIEYYVLPAPQ